MPMENKLEQLLNSLIEKWFRPFWRYDKLMWGWRFWSRQFVKFWMFPEEEFTLRELTSINSGLWQFVCKNGMLKEEHKHERILDPTFWEWWTDCKRQEHDWNYWYRLIESSLKDESELEDFLLSNIKVDVEIRW